MCRFRDTALAAGLFLLVGLTTAVAGERYGLGRDAQPDEVRGWDIDVRPDGAGLPPGRGTAADGEALYMERCASCHGEFGEAAGRFPVLMGGGDTLTSDDPVKTVGSYWPYAATLWDYIRRAMPFGDAQSLTADETYAVTAFVLNLNEIVDTDFVLDQKSLPKIEMPNARGFVLPDPRPDTPAGAPCMTDCKAAVEIMFRATRLDVTPPIDSE